MTYSDEHVARLEAQADAAATERRQLRAIIAELRGVLGTPENASVVQYARDVMAEAQRARDDLAQAQAWIAMLEADLAQTLNKMRLLQPDAAKWRAVPWKTIGDALLGWQCGYAVDDAMEDLHVWNAANKPREDATHESNP